MSAEVARGMRASIVALVVAGCLASLSSVHTSARQGPASPTPAGAPLLHAVLDSYCIGCHNQRLRTGGLALDTVDTATPGGSPEMWERVVAKLRAGSMPPPGRPRPDGATYRTLATE